MFDYGRIGTDVGQIRQIMLNRAKDKQAVLVRPTPYRPIVPTSGEDRSSNPRGEFQFRLFLSADSIRSQSDYH